MAFSPAFGLHLKMHAPVLTKNTPYNRSLRFVHRAHNFSIPQLQSIGCHQTFASVVELDAVLYVANLLVNAVQLHEHVEEQDVVELVSEVTWLQDVEPDPEAIGLQDHTVEEEAFPSESKEEFPDEPTPGKQEESRGAVQRGAEEVVEVEEERTNSVPLCRASASLAFQDSPTNSALPRYQEVRPEELDPNQRCRGSLHAPHDLPPPQFLEQQRPQVLQDQLQGVVPVVLEVVHWVRQVQHESDHHWN